MKVLVDTSVWSRVLRTGGRTEPAARRLDALLGKADVVLTGLVLQEILQAFRSESAFRRVARELDAFPLLQLDRAHYVAAAKLRRSCAAAGIAASTADCQIAAAAIEHRCVLFTLDRDFEAIASRSTLKLMPRPLGAAK